MGTVPLYVWNHLPSADNRDGLVARSEQPVLPEVMEKRKTQLQRLKNEDPYLLEKLVRLFRLFSSVYCPTSPRHIETANLFCEFFELPPPILDARLNAVNYGRLKGTPMAAMKPPHEFIDVAYPGGESWLQCLDRWKSFFNEVLQKYDGSPVLLVGQTRAAIRMCAHLCDGLDIAEAVDLEITDPKVRWVYFYRY